jgi:hypothetical protein
MSSSDNTHLHRPQQNLPRWRSHAKDISRRPLLVKQLTFLAILFALALPLWLYTHAHASITQYAVEPPDGVSPDVALDVHNIIPHHGHNSPGHHANRPIYPGQSSAQVEPQAPSVETIAASPPPPASQTPFDPITFAFIMWEESSATEGALLIKVRMC